MLEKPLSFAGATQCSEQKLYNRGGISDAASDGSQDSLKQRRVASFYSDPGAEQHTASRPQTAESTSVASLPASSASRFKKRCRSMEPVPFMVIPRVDQSDVYEAVTDALICGDSIGMHVLQQ